MKKYGLMLLGLMSVFSAFAELKVGVGVPPLGFVAKQIGQDKIKVLVLMPEGKNPHDFQLTPKEVMQFAGVDLFFHNEMPFEQQLLGMLADKKCVIADAGSGLERYKLVEVDSGEDADGHFDSHIWLSVANLRQIAKNMSSKLEEIDSDNALFYRKNLQIFLEKLDKLEAFEKSQLTSYAGRKILVFHAALGYFARENGLIQLAFEDSGKEITPRQLEKIAAVVKNDRIKKLWVQKNFNPKMIKILKNNLQLIPVEFDPLEYDVIKNLEKITFLTVKSFD